MCISVCLIVQKCYRQCISCLPCYLKFPLTRPLTFLCDTGEERENWQHDSSGPPTQPLFQGALPRKTFLHTNSFAPDLRAKDPQRRSNGNYTHVSPSHLGHCLPRRPSRRQPLWKHEGPQQVSVSGVNYKKKNPIIDGYVWFMFKVLFVNLVFQKSLKTRLIYSEKCGQPLFQFYDFISITVLSAWCLWLV